MRKRDNEQQHQELVNTIKSNTTALRRAGAIGPIYGISGFQTEEDDEVRDFAEKKWMMGWSGALSSGDRRISQTTT